MLCKEEGNCLVRRKDARCVIRWKRTVLCDKEKWILCTVVKKKEYVLFSKKERAFCVYCVRRKEILLYEEEGICALWKENVYLVERTEDLRCVASRKANILRLDNE